MPNIDAAEKWMRQSEKRAKRNKDVKSKLKTLYKRAATGDSQESKIVEAAFDSAARKGIIHPNKAARKKSRLAKALKRGVQAPAKTAKRKSSTKSAKAKK